MKDVEYFFASKVDHFGLFALVEHALEAYFGDLARLLVSVSLRQKPVGHDGLEVWRQALVHL